MTYILLNIFFPVCFGLLSMLVKERKALLGILGSLGSFFSITILLASQSQQLPSSFDLQTLPNFALQLSVDITAVALSIMVAFLGLIISVYAKDYMHDEEGKTSFWAVFPFFLSSMQLLLFAGDWYLFITGWELMGLASYLLIATWNQKDTARKGSLKAFLITRATDLGLYTGVFGLISLPGEYAMVPHETVWPTWIGLCFLLAAAGKSAQVPFQSWLADAMAAPTPVSALLHSATMVAAGAVLFIRIYPMLSPMALLATGLLGGGTIILTSLTAIFSNDIKRMLAASTSSQLGFMFLAIGTGHPSAALAHLIAHGFIKSSLFMAAGIWQKQYDSTLFSRLQSARADSRPTLLLYTIAGMALAGIPPLVGFWSKDAILAGTIEPDFSIWYFGFAGIGVILTGIYMARSIRLLSGSTSTSHSDSKSDSSWMVYASWILIPFITVLGFFLEEILSSMKYTLPSSHLASILGIVMAMMGVTAGWYLKYNKTETKILASIQQNFTIAGGFDHLLVKPCLYIATLLQRLEEKLDKLTQFSGKLFTRTGNQLLYIDRHWNNLVYQLGQLNVLASQGLHQLEETLDRQVLLRTPQSLFSLGAIVRKTQNGLIHQELLWTTLISILIIIILFFIS